MSNPPNKWRAAVCFDSPSITRILRQTLDDLGWSYDRDRALHHFSRLMVVIAIPSNSYVFRFNVKDPVKLKIDVFDERPTHAGDIHFLEIQGITSTNAPKVRKLLNTFSNNLPRKPYDFFFVERFKAGFLNRHHMSSKRQWSKWGV